MAAAGPPQRSGRARRVPPPWPSPARGEGEAEHMSTHRRYAVVAGGKIVGCVNWDGAEKHAYCELVGPLPDGQGLETWGGRSAEELEAALAAAGIGALGAFLSSDVAQPSHGAAGIFSDSTAASRPTEPSRATPGASKRPGRSPKKRT